jgi:alpha-glucosidase
MLGTLTPYLYTAFVEASDTGAPVMRPMLWESQSRELGGIGDQFMVGPHLLVAPILEKGATRRKVWIPEGEWFDYWTSRPVKSGWLDWAAPMDQLPLFVRAGAVLALWPEAPASTMNHHPESLDLAVFVPSKDGTHRSNLIEDDGESFGYSRGERIRTEIELTRSGRAIQIRAKGTGNPYPQFTRTQFRLSLLGTRDQVTQTIPADISGFEWNST